LLHGNDAGKRNEILKRNPETCSKCEKSSPSGSGILKN